MSEKTDTNGPQGHPRQGHCSTARRTRFGLLAAGLLAAGTGIGFGLSYAVSATAGGLLGAGHGHHFGHGGRDRSARTAERVGHVLDEIGATPEQRAQVEAIVADLTDAIDPWKEAHRANRRSVIELLTADAVDRQAIEALRVSELALAETASARVVDALADIAEVLTPEQRTEIAERLSRRHGTGHRPRDGGDDS